MVLYGLQVLREGEFLEFLVIVGAAVFLLCVIGVHEFSHAVTASSLGDQTARRMGRISLDPRVHLDPVGTILLLLFGFGWGKPTPVNPYGLRTGPRTGMALVAAAGPLSNLAMAVLLAAPIRLGWVPWREPFAGIWLTANWTARDFAGLFLSFAVVLNVLLAIFNLLPVAPLDGFKVAVGVLPVKLARRVAQLERYGTAILMVVLFMVFFGNVDILGKVVVPAAEIIVGA